MRAQTQDELARTSHEAKQLMSEGRYDEAIPIYERLTRATPGNMGFVLNLGLAEEMAGRPAKAAPEFEAVLKVDPRNVPALTSLATARLQMNEPQLAISPLQRLLSIEPANHDARGMLAGALMAVGRESDAAAEYRKLTGSAGNDAQAWFGLGKAYEALAAKSFERLEKIAPESAWVLTLVGDSQASRQQYRSAFFFYKQAEEKKADVPTLHAGMARVYEATGHPDWAKQEIAKERPVSERASRETPEGLFLTIKRYNEQAKDAFAKLGALPESVELHALKAEILKGHRQYLEAANEWRAAEKLAPGDLHVRRELEMALFQAKDFQALIPMLEADKAKGDSSAMTNYLLGESLVRTEQPEKAVPYLEAALRQQPDMKQAEAALGLALALLNRQKDAVPHLERSLDLDDDGSLHYQLARAYQASGDTEQAKAMMAVYQKMRSEEEEQKQDVAKEAVITAPQ